MLSTAAVIPLALLALGVAVAHWLGRRAGIRQTIPWRPIFQLIEHRTRCLGQEHGCVERELGPILGVPPWAWHELGFPRRPLARRSGRVPGQRP